MSLVRFDEAILTGYNLRNAYESEPSISTAWAYGKHKGRENAPVATRMTVVVASVAIASGFSPLGIAASMVATPILGAVVSCFKEKGCFNKIAAVGAMLVPGGVLLNSESPQYLANITLGLPMAFPSLSGLPVAFVQNPRIGPGEGVGIIAMTISTSYLIEKSLGESNCFRATMGYCTGTVLAIETVIANAFSRCFCRTRE